MNRIKAEQLSRKLRQDELAKMLNIDCSTIARWESGEKSKRKAFQCCEKWESKV